MLTFEILYAVLPLGLPFSSLRAALRRGNLVCICHSLHPPSKIPPIAGWRPLIEADQNLPKQPKQPMAANLPNQPKLPTIVVKAGPLQLRHPAHLGSNLQIAFFGTANCHVRRMSEWKKRTTPTGIVPFTVYCGLSTVSCFLLIASSFSSLQKISFWERPSSWLSWLLLLAWPLSLQLSSALPSLLEQPSSWLQPLASR